MKTTRHRRPRALLTRAHKAKTPEARKTALAGLVKWMEVPRQISVVDADGKLKSL
jgi:hypothetical protein